MAYPLGDVDARLGPIWHNGSCPSTHPVKVPTMYEIAWDTGIFKDVWPTDGRIR